MRTPRPETAELVRALRVRAGLSVRELARRSGLSPSTITRIEAGAVDPVVGTLRQLAQASGMTLHLSLSPPDRTALSAAAAPGLRPQLGALSDALRTTPAGSGPDWTRLRSFVDWAVHHRDQLPVALARPPASSGSPLLDNLLAAIAEKLSDDADLPRPSWTTQIAPLRDTWRAPLRGAAAQAERAATPAQLLERGIVLGSANLWRAGTGPATPARPPATAAAPG